METVWLRKAQGGTQIGPYSWPEDGSVCEVDERFARSLLAIPGHDFEKVDEPSREITEGPAPEAAEISEAPARPARRGRAKSDDSGTPA